MRVSALSSASPGQGDIAEVMSRQTSAGYTPELLRRGRVFLCGAGAGTANAVLPLSLSGVGSFFVCDMDSYEPSNAPRTPTFPTPREQVTLGLSKARVLAHKIVALTQQIPGQPEPDVRYYAGRIQELPLAAFEAAGVIANGSDNAAARAYAAEQAFLAGRPFIDGGFEGSSLQIGVHVPRDPDRSPCWRCTRSEIFVNDPRRYSCQRAAVETAQHGFIPAIQTVAQIAGALQAEYVIRALHSDFPLENEILQFDVRNGAATRLHLLRNPRCRSRWHAVGALDPLLIHASAAMTWGELLAAAAAAMDGDVAIEPFAWLVERAPCTACGELMDVRSAAWLYEAAPRCRQHGGPFDLLDHDPSEVLTQRVYRVVDQTSSDLLDRELKDFGVGVGDLLIAHATGLAGKMAVLRLEGDASPRIERCFTRVSDDRGAGPVGSIGQVTTGVDAPTTAKTVTQTRLTQPSVLRNGMEVSNNGDTD